MVSTELRRVVQEYSRHSPETALTFGRLSMAEEHEDGVDQNQISVTRRIMMFVEGGDDAPTHIVQGAEISCDHPEMDELVFRTTEPVTVAEGVAEGVPLQLCGDKSIMSLSGSRQLSGSMTGEGLVLLRELRWETVVRDLDNEGENSG